MIEQSSNARTARHSMVKTRRYGAMMQISPAVLEVNGLGEFDCTVEPVFKGRKVKEMLFWISTALVVASLFISLGLTRRTLSIRLVIFILGLLGVFVSTARYYEDRARIDELSALRWTPLTASEIAEIKQSVAGIQPAQPTMNCGGSGFLDSGIS